MQGNALFGDLRPHQSPPSFSRKVKLQLSNQYIALGKSIWPKEEELTLNINNTVMCPCGRYIQLFQRFICNHQQGGRPTGNMQHPVIKLSPSNKESQPVMKIFGPDEEIQLST